MTGGFIKMECTSDMNFNIYHVTLYIDADQDIFGSN